MAIPNRRRGPRPTAGNGDGCREGSRTGPSTWADQSHSNTVSETTLVAIRIDTGERVAIGDVPTDTLRELSDQHLLRCPHCEGLLTLKAGSIRIHHFAHVD